MNKKDPHLPTPQNISGRGAAENPANRFERLAYEPDAETLDPNESRPKTQVFKDSSRIRIGDASMDAFTVMLVRLTNISVFPQV